jgi:hypothetical protein
MRFCAALQNDTLGLLFPDTSQPKPISRSPTPVDAFPALRILSLRKPLRKHHAFADI